MHYDSETGICDYVLYERYREEIDELNEVINQKDIEIEDLKVELVEHKKLINELKELGERIFKDERTNKMGFKQKEN